MVSLCFKNSSRNKRRKSKMVPQSLPRLSQVRKEESWVNAVFACWKSGYLKLFLSHHARICSISNVFDPCFNSIIQVFRVLCAARSLIWNKMLKTIQMKSLQVRKEYLQLSWKNQNKTWVYNLCAKYLCSVTHEPYDKMSSSDNLIRACQPWLH